MKPSKSKESTAKVALKKAIRASKRTHEIMDYMKIHNKWIMTTRFNNSTWDENQNYVKKNQHININCIYPALEPISQTVPKESILFILEMNNEQNRIMGIGMIKNNPRNEPAKYRVYSDQNYNRYTYIGKYRIDRTQMQEEEERIMKFFDILCFTGSNHLKRLRGIKVFPPLYICRCIPMINLIDFITNMFKSRYKATIPPDEKNT